MNLTHDKAFCDTSFFFASLCPDDANFEKAGQLLDHCMAKKISLLTTWDVISETVTLLRYRASYSAAVEFIEKVKPALSIVRYDESVRMTAEGVFKKLARDKRLSFCDAISFVVVTHMLDNIPCLSFDKDFRNLGLLVFP